MGNSRSTVLLQQSRVYREQMYCTPCYGARFACWDSVPPLTVNSVLFVRQVPMIYTVSLFPGCRLPFRVCRVLPAGDKGAPYASFDPCSSLIFLSRIRTFLLKFTHLSYRRIRYRCRLLACAAYSDSGRPQCCHQLAYRPANIC